MNNNNPKELRRLSAIILIITIGLAALLLALVFISM